MQHTIYIRDELVLEARLDGSYILLRREGEPGSVRIYLNEVGLPPFCGESVKTYWA